MLAGLLMLAHVPAMVGVGRRLPLHSTAKLGSRLARSKVGMQQVAAPELVKKVMTGETGNNVTPYIANLLGRDLCAPRPAATCPPARPHACVLSVACARLVRRSHRKEDHPLGIIKFKIEEYFNSLEGQNFEVVDNLEPFVNGKARVLPPHARTEEHTTRRDAARRDASPSCTHGGPREASPHHATPRHTTPRHATPRHATPRHATPRHATPRHAFVSRCASTTCSSP